MNNLKILLSLAAFMMIGVSISAQEPNAPDPEEMIASQVENLEKVLKLDDVEIFYIDSVLRANIPGLLEEMESLRKGGAANQESYVVVSDKWMDAIDKGFEKVLPSEKWERYMKSMYGREKIKRDKRMAKRQNKQ